MTTASKRAIAVIGGSAVVVLSALGITLNEAAGSTADSLSSEMQTGVTITPSAPTTVLNTKATPTITGPAQLPAEEQGLPG